MRATAADLAAAYLPAIVALPFVKGARLAPPGRTARDGEDALLDLKTTAGRHRLSVHVLGSHVGRATLGHLQALAARASGDWIVFAPYVSRPTAVALGGMGLNFADRAGNVRLVIGKAAFASVEGRSPARSPTTTRGWRAPGLLAVFAFLARPDWLDAPVRTVAGAVGVSKNAVADARRRLVHEGFVVETASGRVLVQTRRLRDRWLAAFADVLWPSLVVGRFRTADRTPGDLESRIEAALAREAHPWGFGGGVAAARLTGHFRGATTTLWIDRQPTGISKHLHALPDRNGPMIVVRAPGPLVFEGKTPRTVHPLLVWAELLSAGDERSAEAAALLAEHEGWGAS